MSVETDWQRLVQQVGLDRAPAQLFAEFRKIYYSGQAAYLSWSIRASSKACAEAATDEQLTALLNERAGELEKFFFELAQEEKVRNAATQEVSDAPTP